MTFPAQIPVFMKPPKGYTQQRAVQLYFARGRPVHNICNRYNLAKKIVQDLLSDWRIRAISGGLIQKLNHKNSGLSLSRCVTNLYPIVLEQASHQKHAQLPGHQSALDFHPSLRAMKDDAATAASEL